MKCRFTRGLIIRCSRDLAIFVTIEGGFLSHRALRDRALRDACAEKGLPHVRSKVQQPLCVRPTKERAVERTIPVEGCKSKSLLP